MQYGVAQALMTTDAFTNGIGRLSRVQFPVCGILNPAAQTDMTAACSYGNAYDSQRQWRISALFARGTRRSLSTGSEVFCTLAAQMKGSRPLKSRHKIGIQPFFFRDRPTLGVVDFWCSNTLMKLSKKYLNGKASHTTHSYMR